MKGLKQEPIRQELCNSEITRSPLTRNYVPDCFGHYTHLSDECMSCYCEYECKVDDWP